LNKDELNKLALVNSPGRTIGDQIALSIGSLGENMSLRRAVVFNIKEGEHLSWYMHGSCMHIFVIVAILPKIK
jgi:translation elongation factor EF-Ts